MKIKLQLHTRITLLITSVILISILNTAFFIIRWRMANIRKDIEKNIMNVAQIMASAPVVKENLDKNSDEMVIQRYMESMLKATKEIDVIVAADMEGIRHGHPNPDRIGWKFVGGDETRVIQKGESYISEAKGTMGEQIRAFAPVFNNQGKQVGFIMAGQLIKSVERVKKEALAIVIFSSLGGLFIGIIGAFVLAKNIKRTLLGLEPEQISKLYVEKQEILEAMQEGIIAVDSELKITLINKAALKMLKVGSRENVTQEITGRDINEVFPTCRLPEIIFSGKKEMYKEQLINDTIVMINRVPIKEGGRVVGAIATFNDKTRVTKLAEEVTGENKLWKP
jgi:sensor histidine kinase regulating citrate/malate metabolism